MIGHSLGEYVAACLAGVFTPRRRARTWSRAGRGSCRSCRRGPCSPCARPRRRSRRPRARASRSRASTPRADRDLGRSRRPSSSRRSELREPRDRGQAARHVARVPLPDDGADRRALRRDGRRRSARRARRLPFVSSLTGDWITDAQATDPAYWARQLREPVRFADGAARLLEDPGRVFLEVGPGQTLTTLLRQQPTGAARRDRSLRSRGPAMAPRRQSLLTAAGRLWSAGATSTGSAFTRTGGGGGCRCRPIPSNASDTGSTRRSRRRAHRERRRQRHASDGRRLRRRSDDRAP